MHTCQKRTEMSTIAKTAFSCLPFSLLMSVCYCSHFRGAMVFWKQNLDGTSIDIDYRQAWRRTSQYPECNETTIAQGFNYSGGVLRQKRPYFGYLYSSFNAPFEYECTDYSVKEDWQSGRGHISFIPNDTSTNFYEMEYSGCCWIDTLEYGAGSSWALIVKMNTTIRKDTLRMNASPRIDFPPIVRLQYGCNHTIHLPVSDEDGDEVKCRWATSLEAAGISNAFPSATIDKDTCEIDYSAEYTSGWYAVAVQIEDFNYNISSSPLSSIPLQFLVSVENNSRNCSTYQHERPKFVGLTLPDKACVGVMNGTDFTTNITIESGSDSGISEVNTISPVGLIKSSLALSNLTGNWHISVKWNPGKADSVNNVFCFTAIDDSGLSSDQRCITLLAGVPPANVIASSKLPASHVVPKSQRIWSVKFDQESKQPTKSAYIYLHHSNGTLVERIDVSRSQGITYSFSTSTTELQFTTSAELQPGEDYYFLFGQGLVQGKSYCGAESKSVLDSNFWKFSVRTEPDHLTDVEVRCYKGYSSVPCEKSFLSCEDDWSFHTPCNQVDTQAVHTKFPHPTSIDKFLTCLSGKTYIAICPPGEIFHTECSECAPREFAPPASCKTEARGVANPCTSQSIVKGKQLFPYPGNSNKYIYCDVWGYPWEQQCQIDYNWDDIKQMCV